jgi:DNA-binding CsgD family transcriptional regulator
LPRLRRRTTIAGMTVTDVRSQAATRGSGSTGPGRQLLADASERLRATVPFDGAAWFATDPATILPTTPVLIENVVPGYCESYWQREFTVEDFLLFRDVARSPAGGGTLYAATGGSPARSPRYREFLVPQHYGDELRAAFRTGPTTWGVVDLFRDSGREPFAAADVERVTTTGAALAVALAELTTEGRPSVPGGADCPGTAVFDAADRLCSVDDQAERWFADIAASGWDHPSTDLAMAPVLSVVNRARAVAAGREPGPAYSRMRTREGRWLSVHASCLRDTGGDSRTVAVVIEQADPALVAPIVTAAYGLTPRELEISGAVSRGLSNVEIATELFLSRHTVRDHLKAVFAKLSVASRGELMATLYTEQYAPAIHEPDADAEHVFW